MNSQTSVIKRDGQRPSENFSKEKLRASILGACLSVRTPVGQAETTAKSVSDSVTSWLTSKPEVTSADLRRIAAQHLKTHNPDAAYIYEQHRITI
jgi:transcriptional regulator NrdR family protein